MIRQMKKSANPIAMICNALYESTRMAYTGNLKFNQREWV